MSQEDPNTAQTREPLRPEVFRIQEPPTPFGFAELQLQSIPQSASGYSPRFPRLPLVLFVLTCLSTWFSGYLFFGLWGGLTYSLCVMAILGAHEMGHYLQSVRYGVPASLPLFIPMPFSPLGTMGAVIFQRPGVAGRRAMYDIAISGPLAGLIVALPILWYGLKAATVLPFHPGGHGITFADPLLLKLLSHWIHGPLGEGEDLLLNPFLLAGWVGVFITALNLFPLGQLDGGHILYTLLGRRSHPIARTLFRALVLLVIWAGVTQDSGYFGWGVMLFLVGSTGVEHPPTSNDAEPLGRFRKVLGWITLTFVIWGFMPRPIYETHNERPPSQTKPAAGTTSASSTAIPSGPGS